ncbi:glycosyltransferase family 2 protein [bacterium]|nr:glycosyltransferase family 2 protein [bacterium]
MIMSLESATLESDGRTRLPHVAVVIVNYRTPLETIACVKSLAWQTHSNLSVIVVDNDSPDGSAELLDAELSNVELIRAPKNGGYTSGNNLGIESALAHGADYVLVLNPDTRALNDCFIARLIEFAESHPDVAAVGPRVHLRQVGHVQNTILEFPWLTRRVGGVMKRIAGRRLPARSGNDPRPAEVLNGVCVLFRAEALFDVGTFDERTFAYIEDVDWGYRAAENGWLLWYLPVDSIVHEQKEAGYDRGSMVDFLLKRNTLYFLLKHRKPVQAAAYTLSTLSLGLAHWGMRRLRDRRWLTGLARAYGGLWLGRWDAVMGRPNLERHP